MSEIEKEVTRYMITTDSSSTEAVESGKSLVESKYNSCL